MNKTRINLLADHIEKLEWGCEAGDFNMARTSHVCDSPACIAGWAVFLFGDPDDLVRHPRTVMGKAANLLDIDCCGMRDVLFCPQVQDEWGRVAYMGSEPGDSGYISPWKAARTLRHLAETGEVDWEV